MSSDTTSDGLGHLDLTRGFLADPRLELLLEAAHQPGEQEGDHEVDEQQIRVDAGALLEREPYQVAAERQIAHAHHGHQRGALEQFDQQVGERRDHLRHRLRQQDQPEPLPGREAQRDPALLLRRVDRLERSAHDLGAVRPVGQSEGERARPHRHQLPAEGRGQHEEHPEDHHQRRGPAEHLGVEAREEADDPQPVGTQDADHEGHGGGEDRAEEQQLDRGPDALEYQFPESGGHPPQSSFAVRSVISACVNPKGLRTRNSSPLFFSFRSSELKASRRFVSVLRNAKAPPSTCGLPSTVGVKALVASALADFFTTSRVVSAVPANTSTRPASTAFSPATWSGTIRMSLSLYPASTAYPISA